MSQICWILCSLPALHSIFNFARPRDVLLKLSHPWESVEEVFSLLGYLGHMELWYNGLMKVLIFVNLLRTDLLLQVGLFTYTRLNPGDFPKLTTVSFWLTWTLLSRYLFGLIPSLTHIFFLNLSQNKSIGFLGGVELLLCNFLTLVECL